MKDTDIQKISDLLRQLKPGFLPYPIFEQIARLVALPIIEFIPLRISNGNTEVLLLKRPKDDPLWPNELHTPGTVIRATDLIRTGEKWKPFERILKEELNDTPVSDPYFVGNIMHQSRRGTECAQLYWVEVLGEPSVGEFYPVESLPSEFMDSQIKFVKQAASSFKSNKH